MSSEAVARAVDAVRAAASRVWAYERAERHAFWAGAGLAVAGGSALLLLRLLRRRLRGAPALRRNRKSQLHHVDWRAANRNSRSGDELRLDLAEAAGAAGAGAGAADPPIYQIVITGGQCAGKSSSQDMLVERLRALHFDVYSVPEVPTLLLNGGCEYPGMDGDQTRLVTFEASLVELQLQFEQTFFNIAKATGRPSVIIYDRGLLDVAAYMPRALWPEVVNYNQWLRDGLLSVLDRYDLILHLTTAAAGAEKHFSIEGTSLEEARALDAKIQASYKGHPAHFVVDNSTDFQRKLDRVYEHARRLLLDDVDDRP